MRKLTFSKLYLLSDREHRALKIEFGKRPTIVQALNGYGKSAVIKSLYEAFGATPHKIDGSWKSAQIATIVEFAIDGVPYTAVRDFGVHGIFDQSGKLLIRTNRLTKELSPFLADLLDFRLLMTTREEETIIPPPSYIFAPFYIDQDHGWLKPWTSFKDLFLPRSSPTLAEYHAGIKPNAFYEAQARRDRLAIEAREIDGKRKGLDQAISEIRAASENSNVQFSISDFAFERERLVVEADTLLKAQAENRRVVGVRAEEWHLWKEQVALLTSALAEMDVEFAASLSEPSEVECPTCGQHYENSIVERFQLVENKDGLIEALVHARHKAAEAVTAFRKAQSALSEVESSLARVREIMSITRAGLSFEEILAAEGRNEATKILQEKLNTLDEEWGRVDRQIQTQAAAMKEASNPVRARQIKAEFNQTMHRFAALLDVRLEDRRRQPLHSAGKTRGSEGAREMLAYYYAFFHTASAHGSATFCPIVIDAPNQQGQDEHHLPKILQFIVEEKPAERQVIVAVEDASAFEGYDVDIVEVGHARRQVLREAQFEEVSTVARPLLTDLLFG